MEGDKKVSESPDFECRVTSCRDCDGTIREWVHVTKTQEKGILKLCWRCAWGTWTERRAKELVMAKSGLVDRLLQ